MSEILERFTRIVRDTPLRPLVHVPGNGITLTAGTIWTHHLAFRTQLENARVGSDDLVMCAAGNHAAVPALWLACRSLAAAVMPVDVGTTPAEIYSLAARFGATTAVMRDAVAPEGAERFTEGLKIVRFENILPAPHLYKGAAAVKLTSASTGEPKATFTTEAQLVLDSEHIMDAMGIGPDDCQLASIPISHAYGLGNLVVPMLVNATPFVLREGFVPHQLTSDASTYGIRAFPGVPYMFDHVIAHHPKAEWPRTLRILVSAGARLEASTIGQFLDAFAVKIHSFYGTTESGGITYDDSDEFDGNATVGRSIPGVRISLRPDEGAPADGGRVHVSSEAVASGYAGELPSQDGFTGDGFLTGDYGRFDGNGCLVLTGRASSFINVAGRKVQPEEVEQVLRQIPGVVDARVIAAPDPVRGQQIIACLVTRGTDPSTLAVRQFCAARLAPYKIPRTVLKLDRIPLTERGKTHRAALEALVREHLDGTERSRML